MKRIIVSMAMLLALAVSASSQSAETKSTCDQKLAVVSNQYSQEKNLSIERETQMLVQHMALQDEIAKVRAELSKAKDDLGKLQKPAEEGK